MSFLHALDATRVAQQWYPPTPDAAAAPEPETRVFAATTYSWWSLARNPKAVLVTGLVGTMMAGDALRAALSTD